MNHAAVPLIVAATLLTATGTDTGGPSSVTDILTLLREFGFPIFVAVWFMYRLEKRLDRYTEQIEKLYTTVTIMAKTLEERGE